MAWMGAARLGLEPKSVADTVGGNAWSHKRMMGAGLGTVVAGPHSAEGVVAAAGAGVTVLRCRTSYRPPQRHGRGRQRLMADAVGLQGKRSVGVSLPLSCPLQPIGGGPLRWAVVRFNGAAPGTSLA
ncbi:unnamed protein product, partial [Brenthis ino]